MRRLYLSPSNQPANRYAAGGTNEKVQMEAVAKSVEFYLREYEIETIMASFALQFPQRDEEAIAKNCTDYLAIHSNAGGGGTAIGTVAFYHPDQPETKAVAERLVIELDKICPFPENRFRQVQDGMVPYNGFGLGEIREPAKKGMNSTLVEVNFHDNPVTAQWIIGAKDLIAQAIVKAYVGANGINKKVVVKPINVVKPPAVEKKPLLKVDGLLGPKTIKALQAYFGTTQDGIISEPSWVVKKLQALLKVKTDGDMGPITIKALQKRMGTQQDGIISEPSMCIKELQRRLNEGKL